MECFSIIFETGLADIDRILTIKRAFGYASSKFVSWQGRNRLSKSIFERSLSASGYQSGRTVASVRSVDADENRRHVLPSGDGFIPSRYFGHPVRKERLGNDLQN